MMIGLTYHVENQENSAINSMYENECILTELKWKKKKYSKSRNMDRLPRRHKSLNRLEQAVQELGMLRLDKKMWM